MLEDLGHTVREANSGEEALNILAEGAKIDLVVTDQAMPRMTGVQLAEAILAEQPNLPIILATGYAELPSGLGSVLPQALQALQPGTACPGPERRHHEARKGRRQHSTSCTKLE